MQQVGLDSLVWTLQHFCVMAGELGKDTVRRYVFKVTAAFASCCCYCGCCTGMVASAVSAVLCTHFRVSTVLRLGYGPVQALIQAAEEDAGAAAATPAAAPGADAAGGAAADSGISCWSALALTSSGETHMPTPTLRLTPVPLQRHSVLRA